MKTVKLKMSTIDRIPKKSYSKLELLQALKATRQALAYYRGKFSTKQERKDTGGTSLACYWDYIDTSNVRIPSNLGLEDKLNSFPVELRNGIPYIIEEDNNE